MNGKNGEKKNRETWQALPTSLPWALSYFIWKRKSSHNSSKESSGWNMLAGKAGSSTPLLSTLRPLELEGLSPQSTGEESYMYILDERYPLRGEIVAGGIPIVRVSFMRRRSYSFISAYRMIVSGSDGAYSNYLIMERFPSDARVTRSH